MNTNAFLSVVLMVLGTCLLSGQESYKTLIYKGNQNFDKKNYDAASSRYAEAAKVNEKDFTAHYNLGNALYKNGKYDEAKAEFEKAEKLSQTLPDKSAALYNLGNAHMQLRDTEKASQLYKQALKQDPYNEVIRKNYEIAKLKEKEKQQQQQKNKSSNGGDHDQKDQKKGDEKGNLPKQEQGNGEQNKGQGKGNDPNKNNDNSEDQMPKDLENAILNRVENKERETAKRILNKNSYSMPQSNEKDW